MLVLLARAACALTIIAGAARLAHADAPHQRADAWDDVSTAIPDAVLDLRYATDHNIAGAVLYPVPRCLLRHGVAVRLARAERALRKAHRRLVMWDCYRPASVQPILWQAQPDPSLVARPRFADDGTPLSGSDHSRGAAVDVSLADDDGAPLAMPTELDDATSAARRAHALDASADARVLDGAMRAAGFRPLASEWWHFAAPDARDFALSDRALSD